MNELILKGHIIHTPIMDSFEIHEDSYVLVRNGKVQGIFKELEKIYKDIEIKDYSGKLIIPGFADIHLHAVQYPNRGLGVDKELIPWLNTYTFPEESKYEDLDYAKKVFSRLIKDLWRNGTTRASVYSSIHKDATKLLMDMFIESGLGAFVGKVNMDRNSPPSVTEDTKQSLLDTEEILKEYNNKLDLVKPIITPRFVPSCTSELMEGLGRLAKEYKVPIQSHLNENRSEVEWVKELHPDSQSYGHVYKDFNLINRGKTIMAHCIYNSEVEMDLMKEYQVYAAHCPNSNYNLSSGIMPVRKYLDKGIPVGLASDISGGHNLSISQTMATAAQASKMVWLENKDLKPLSTAEVFYLGTKGGASLFGKVGSFEKDYEFDALVIDDSTFGDVEELSLEERIQKFIYIGDDRNIIERYVGGKVIKEPKFN